jgi:hypothetical protein
MADGVSASVEPRVAAYRRIPPYLSDHCDFPTPTRRRLLSHNIAWPMMGVKMDERSSTDTCLAKLRNCHPSR